VPLAQLAKHPVITQEIDKYCETVVNICASLTQSNTALDGFLNRQIETICNLSQDLKSSFYNIMGMALENRPNNLSELTGELARLSAELPANLPQNQLQLYGAVDNVLCSILPTDVYNAGHALAGRIYQGIWGDGNDLKEISEELEKEADRIEDAMTTIAVNESTANLPEVSPNITKPKNTPTCSKAQNNSSQSKR
jgi:hypothetical protein